MTDMPDNSRRLSDLHRAEATVEAGRHLRLSASAQISNGGLLCVAALLSSALLSTAVLVHVAVKRRHRRGL